MAKTDNLGDFLKDVADSIRTKTQTTELINAQDFSDKILSIQTGGGENTLKKLLDTTKSTRYFFDHYNGVGDALNGLIQYNDTENVTDMYYMFNYCQALDTIPLFDTSKVTNMGGMFRGVTNIRTIPQFDTSNVIDMREMFSYCYYLTTVPQLNTSNVTNMSYMFYYCQYSLTTVPLLDTSKVTSMSNMFKNCTKLTTIPQFNTSNVTSMYYMLSGCGALATIPQLNTSNVTNMDGMFFSCKNLTTVPALDANKVTSMMDIFTYDSNLKSILMTNIGANLNISSSTKFEREDLLIILNNLKTITSSKKLTMGATNLAKLTDEDKLIATNKGWTLA